MTRFTPSLFIRRLLPILALAGGLALLLPGCVGYRLGSMLPPDIKTVYLENLDNQTNEPLVEQDIMQALVEEIQQDGSLRVVRDPGEADAVLRVSLVGFRLAPLAFADDNATLTEEYRLNLTAAVELERTDTDEVLVANPSVRGEADFPFSGDLTTTKRQALPDAAEDLAHDIVETLVETW